MSSVFMGFKRRIKPVRLAADAKFKLPVKFLAVLCLPGMALVCGVKPALGAAGDIIKNGQATQPNYVAPGSVTAAGVPGAFIVPGFLFEPEVPLTSLKDAPTWNEIEQVLDNPYAITYDPNTPGNEQGFPSYRTAIIRRPAFGVVLPQFLIDPLNYNPTSGEEMRLLNSAYPGGNFSIPYQLYQDLAGDPSGNTWRTSYRTVAVSPGAARVLEAEIDYNSPINSDGIVCEPNVELVPPEGVTYCGGDTGEPGNPLFGVINGAYSVPAFPMPAGFRNPGAVITALPGGPLGAGQKRLFDPVRGFINARNPAGVGGLLKPSLRIPENGGNNANPNYLRNTNPDDTAPSTENDYYARAVGQTATSYGAGPIPNGRNTAIILGKALFWDMQVGSDGIQSCGTCHFNGTGTDTRTKNQVNPNHLGGDVTFQIHGGAAPNTYDLTAADFPLHKVGNPDAAGDPGGGRLTASVNAGVLENTNQFPGGVAADFVVQDPANIVSDVNDVVSSMGVVYSHFTDIAPIGAFGPAVNGVAAVMPDLRTAGDPDPIPLFQGLRRVEPRNTPTMQAAGFNFDNFWDGRARHDFNGGSVFGASDPQAHVWVTNGVGQLVATRQLIKFASIASLATGPGLSEFEMSFQGRNWQKVGKKLLQANVVPLANQLVDPTDSVLGPFSGQRSTYNGPINRVGRPGLNVSYQDLIRASYRPELWANTSQHLTGAYTPVNAAGQTAPIDSTKQIPILVGAPGSQTVDTANPNDPFDGFVLTGPLAGASSATDTMQFSQMEANFSLFWGLSVHAWVQILVPDNTPLDQFLEANPDAFATLGEPGERGLVEDQLNCGGGRTRYCFTPVGNFKRDPNLIAYINSTGEGGTGATPVPVTGGTRQPSDPDPLLGFDIFFASNLSLKNPNFRTARCGECHASPTLTDHTVPFTFKATLRDFAAEFPPGQPGVEGLIEPLGRMRMISGFLLESELNGPGQDAVERRMINQSIIPNPSDGLSYPDGIFNPAGTAAGNEPGSILISSIPGDSRYAGAGQSFFDNGVYNLGVTLIDNDIGRGGNDAFGWPLSLAAMLFKNLGGPAYEPATLTSAGSGPLPNFDPDLGTGGGLFEETSQDQQINPGVETEGVINPMLPAYLAPFANQLNVGDSQPELDEQFGAINTLTDVPILEGFLDSLGPINAGGRLNEAYNSGENTLMGTWPTVNRVARMGSFKAPQLRNVELTGPYFHNGGKLTLRQVVDFYVRGGDFPISNAEHRDFNMVNMNVDVQSNLSEAEKVSLVDFLLELTDERNRFDRAPFDHPEVIVPVDGTAPDNGIGRTALLAATVPVTDPVTLVTTPALFRDVPAVGAAGLATPEPSFLNVSRFKRSDSRFGTAADNFATVSHYDH
ncbi:MAG TPA: hypothetical protein VJA21_30840 [Verrucomicrobiae bacterium]